MKFSSNDLNTNHYIPKSEIIIFAKKSSFVNALVLLKEDFTKPWTKLNITTEIEKYDQCLNKNMHICEENGEKKMKKSKSDPEMTAYKSSATTGKIINLNLDAGKEKIEKAAEELITTIDDNCNFGNIQFNLDCPHCFHANNLANNTGFICKKCGKDLFG